MATKEFTNDELNYFRLCYVITRIVPDGLRIVFKQEWDTRYKATHGQWIDTTNNAIDFYNMESTRNRNRKARELTVMANGNTSEWDCTCLFYAILYSDSLGTYLNTAVKKSVEELREVRNEVFAHTFDGSLTDVDFQKSIQKILDSFKNLGLNSSKVDEIKIQTSFPTEELRNIQQKFDDEKKRFAKFQSFCVLPPKPSHDTTERLDEISTICQQMEKLRNAKKNETTVIFLSGNPGCGKSELARQIGEKYFKEISETARPKFLFTLNASSIDKLLESYVDFAGRISIDEDSVSRIATSKDLGPEDKIKSIRSLINTKMQIYSSWLIIVDNVINLKLVSNYVPQAGEKTIGDGQILVTTQDRQSIPCDSYTYHSRQSLGMNEEDAIRSLWQISGLTSDKEIAMKVAKALDFQPLALACAAIYMQRINRSSTQSKTNWEKYLLKLQEGKREATETVYKDTSLTYSATMTAAVRFALEREASEDKIMKHAFQFLSIIANDPIPLKYVVQYVINCMPDQDEDLVASQICESSLVISSEEESKEIRVHQVVYGCLQTNVTRYETAEEFDILNLMLVFSDLEISQNPEDASKLVIIETRPLVSHFVIISTKLQKQLEHRPSFKEKYQHMTHCLSNVGSICLVHGQYKASEIYIQTSLSIQQCAYDKKGPVLAKTQYQNEYTNQTELLKTQNESKNNSEKRLGITDSTNADFDLSMAVTLKRLGVLCSHINEYGRAKRYFERAVAIEENVLDTNHLEMANTLNKLGTCLDDLGEYERAETCLMKALAIQEKSNVQDENPSIFADVLKNLALNLNHQGKCEKAKRYCEGALEIIEKVCDENNPRHAYILNDLAIVLFDLNQKENAFACSEKAIQICKNVYGQTHPLLATALTNQGLNFYELRQYENAKSYLERALAICVNLHDANQQKLAKTLHNLGSCLIDLRQYENAKTYLERALAIYENLDDDASQQNLATTLNNLGLCLIHLRQYENAKTYLERALAIRENLDDDTSQQNLATTLLILGLRFFHLGQYENAN